jgi:hypothetical protein
LGCPQSCDLFLVIQVVVLGTGLVESIVAAAAARGKTIHPNFPFNN